MTNIVERLRFLYEPGSDERAIADDAADEIERLRQRVESLEGYAEGCMEEFNRAQSDLTELRKAQSEPFAWATFDGEGGYDLRLYANNENYRVDYIIRNGQKYADWVYPLYTSAPSIPDCNTCTNRGEVDGLSQESHCDHCIYGAKYRTNHYAPKPK